MVREFRHPSADTRANDGLVGLWFCWLLLFLLLLLLVSLFCLLFYARLCPAQFSAMLGFGKRVAEKGGANWQRTLSVNIWTDVSSRRFIRRALIFFVPFLVFFFSVCARCEWRHNATANRMLRGFDVKRCHRLSPSYRKRPCWTFFACLFRSFTNSRSY